MREKLRKTLDDILRSELWKWEDDELESLVELIMEEAEENGVFEDSDESSN